MSDEIKQIGRLALRQEGNFWKAYYALPDTMDDPVLLGSITMKAHEHQERREAFVDLMREVVGDLLEEQIGERPTWGGEEQAPESEKAGHS